MGSQAHKQTYPCVWQCGMYIPYHSLPFPVSPSTLIFLCVCKSLVSFTLFVTISFTLVPLDPIFILYPSRSFLSPLLPSFPLLFLLRPLPAPLSKITRRKRGNLPGKTVVVVAASRIHLSTASREAGLRSLCRQILYRASDREGTRILKRRPGFRRAGAAEWQGFAGAHCGMSGRGGRQGAVWERSCRRELSTSSI